MVAFEFSRPERRRGMLNITPLIDVIFLLIVFYLLTSKFVVIESLTLDLTSSSKQEIVSPNKESIIISIYGDQHFSFGQIKGKLAVLGDTLKERFDNLEQRSIVISIDQYVKVQQLVASMDQIKQAGGKNISLISHE